MAKAPRATVRTSEVNVVPAGSQTQGDSGGGIKGTIKQHPYATSAVAALGVSALYLIYRHFHNASSSTPATTATSTSGFPLTTGSGTRHGGGWAGMAGGGGSGGGGDTGSSSGGGGTTGSTGPSTVDLSGLNGLFANLSSELGLLGQEIGALGSPKGGGGPPPKPGNGGGAVSTPPAPTYGGLTASQIIARPTANPGATTQYVQAQAQMPVSQGGSIPTYTGTPLGPGTLVITSGLQPQAGKQVASTPRTSSGPNVMAEPPALNRPAPSASTISSEEKQARSVASNTQAVHAQQTAKAAAKPPVRTSVGGAHLTKG